MSETLPQPLIAEKNLIATASTWVWLFDVEFNKAKNVLHLTNNEDEITFPVGKKGKKYQPFPIVFDQLAQTGKGDLSSLRITVSNVSREVGSFLERYDGLRGERVTVTAVNSANLGDAAAKVSQTFHVKSSTANEKVATFELAPRDLFNMRFPRRRYLRRTCRWIFASEECGWGFDPLILGPSPPVGVTESFFCDKTMDGTLGCKFHGGLYEQAGQPSLWPQRFGGFPTIPKRSGP